MIAYPAGKTPEQEAIENLLAEKERLELQLEAAIKQNAELVRSIEWRARTNHELNKMASAIRWACGYDEGDPDFSARPKGAGPYWWRSELLRRAGMSMNGEVTPNA